MVSFAAAVFGVALAVWGVDVARAALPENLFRADTIAVNLRVLTAAVCAAVMAALLFGVVPAWSGARAQPTALLASGSGAVTRAPRRWRTALITAEVALAGSLLVVTTLFVSSFGRIVRADLGFLRPDLIGFTLEDFKGPTTSVLDALRATPGVVAVAEWAGPPPFLLRGGAMTFRGMKAAHHADQPGEILAAHYRVAPGYFETAGIAVVRGRPFTEADAESPVAIIDELAARLLFFDGRNPLSAEISLGPGSPLLTIVGIVRTVSREGPERETGTQLYRPRASGAPGASRFLVRASAPIPQVIPGIQHALRRALPAGTQMPSIQSLDETFRTMTADRRANATLMSIFGVVVLLIGAAGVYAVITSTVVQRRRELALRVALGATRGRIIRDVLAGAGAFLMAGLIVGLVAGHALSHLFASMLFQVTPTDASTYVVVAVLLTASGLAAALRPALRAGRVDPIVTLRME